MRSLPRSNPRSSPSSSSLAAALAIAALAFVAGRLSASAPAPRVSAAAAAAAVSSYAAAATAAAAAVVSAPLPPFRFAPEVTRVWINIGSHKDPPRPAFGSAEESYTAVVAVEPVMQTAMRINRTLGGGGGGGGGGGDEGSRVHVVCAAISDAAGFASMETFNSGASSSLSEPEPGRWWALPGSEHRTHGMPRFAFVPVLTLEMLLAAVPAAIDIALLKTDMQGHDFRAVAAARRAALRRVRRLMTEVYCGDFREYVGAANALERDWLPHMRSMGFALDAAAAAAPPCSPGHVGEADATWVRVEEEGGVGGGGGIV